jgi:hypothetical protein
MSFKKNKKKNVFRKKKGERIWKRDNHDLLLLVVECPAKKLNGDEDEGVLRTRSQDDSLGAKLWGVMQ